MVSGCSDKVSHLFEAQEGLVRFQLVALARGVTGHLDNMREVRQFWRMKNVFDPC